jgi:hypothetical protein
MSADNVNSEKWTVMSAAVENVTCHGFYQGINERTNQRGCELILGSDCQKNSSSRGSAGGGSPAVLGIRIRTFLLVLISDQDTDFFTNRTGFGSGSDLHNLYIKLKNFFQLCSVKKTVIFLLY